MQIQDRNDFQNVNAALVCVSSLPGEERAFPIIFLYGCITYQSICGFRSTAHTDTRIMGPIHNDYDASICYMHYQ